MRNEGGNQIVLHAPGRGRGRIHPKKFALYASFASMVMLFSGLTSAFIVRQAQGNWLEFPMPSLFYWSTVIIVASSLTLHGSFIAFKKGNQSWYRTLLVVSFFLGVGFTIAQYQAWLQMFDQGIYLNGNPSGSFIYVISGIHAAHVLGGLGALLVAIVHAFVLPFYRNPVRKLRFEMTLIYWHFVDFLWIYLLLFFLFQQPA
ncbi:MAG: cytochrome oxidase subunit III [Saprospiraceae bacterium]|nr:cytochrome oxidase subunit III [Saprospiraceae bacterium]